MQAIELGQQLVILRGGRQGLAELLMALQQHHPFAATGEHLLKDRELWIQRRFLIQEHHAGFRGAAPFPLIEGFPSGQHPQQGAFAGAVGADQAEAIPFAHVQVQIGEQGAQAEVLARTHQADQAHDARPAPVAWRCRSRWANTLLSPMSAAAAIGNLRRQSTRSNRLSRASS